MGSNYSVVSDYMGANVFYVIVKIQIGGISNPSMDVKTPKMATRVLQNGRWVWKRV